MTPQLPSTEFKTSDIQDSDLTDASSELDELDPRLNDFLRWVGATENGLREAGETSPGTAVRDLHRSAMIPKRGTIGDMVTRKSVKKDVHYRRKLARKLGPERGRLSYDSKQFDKLFRLGRKSVRKLLQKSVVLLRSMVVAEQLFDGVFIVGHLRLQCRERT